MHPLHRQSAYHLIQLCLLALLSGLLLAGCAQPLSQQIAHAYGQTDRYVLRTEALIDAGAIDKATAQQRLDRAKQARIALRAAEAALVACGDARDCATAQARLDAAQVILDELERQFLTGALK